MSRNSHSRAGCSISDPGSDYSHQYRALVLEISARGRLVLPYSCPRRDDDVGPRKTVVRTDGWEPWPHARARQHQTQGKPPGQIPSLHATYILSVKVIGHDSTHSSLSRLSNQIDQDLIRHDLQYVQMSKKSYKL